MVRRCVGVLVVFAVLSFLTASAHAQGTAAKTFWIGPVIGIGTYAMSDVNDDINNISAVTGLSMDEITNGVAFGAEAGLQVTPMTSIFAVFERVTASSEVGDYSGSLEYKLPANVFLGGVQQSFPSSSQFQFGLAALAGIVSSAGEINLSITGEGAVSGDISGSGPVAEARLVGDYIASPALVISTNVGYRFAKISEIKVEDQTVFNPDGSKEAVDYSGITARVLLKIFLG